MVEWRHHSLQAPPGGSLHLSLEPAEQRRVLEGFPVTDELTLDLDHAVLSLEYTSEQAGIRLPEGVVAALERLNRAFGAHGLAGQLGNDGALDRHPMRAEARSVARQLLPQIPQ
jgi:hypothetical protein